MAYRAKLKRTFSRLLSILSAMRRLRHCVSQNFAISDSESDTEATYQASETRHHVAFDSVTKRRGRDVKYFCFPVSPKKRVRSSSLPPIPVLKSTAVEDSIEASREHDLVNLYHIIETDEYLLSPQKCTACDRPHLQWLTEGDVYLAELLRLEGRGDFIQGLCQGCQMSLLGFGFRCADYHDLGLYCQNCLVKTHAFNPLHRVHRWSGKKFERVPRKELGLRVQLGHPVGEWCVSPVTAFNDAFVVLDVTGVHEVGVDFCGCERAMAHCDRYQSFLLMVNQWRHLKMLKRAGRGNDPAGVAATQPGACAVECLACPHPGKNMPALRTDNDRPEESESKLKSVGSTVKRWWQTLYLTIDTIFRLKRKQVSSELVDSCLNNGSLFFVEETAYKAHLAPHARDNPMDESEKCCNSHDAIKVANIKGSETLAASHVVTVGCSRHDMKRACSVSDLQHSEQQVNIDHLLDSSLSHCAPKRVDVTYDVACVYLDDYGFPTLDDRDVSWAVPTCHLNAHRKYCRSVVSTHALPEWGWTNGEGVERGWSWINHFASSMKEMGPGSRRDLLDDVFNHWNWNNVITMPATLLSRLEFALPNRETYVRTFEALTASIPASHVSQWLQMVTMWEVDPCNANIPNPYVAQRSHLSQNKIWLELAQEDSDEVKRGEVAPLHAEYSASTLIIVGMELEDQQRRLCADLHGLGIHSTSLQRAKLLERRNTLQRRIDEWRSAQQLFMPCVASLLVESARIDGSPEAQNTPLFLPSAIFARHDVSTTLLNHEWRLREAQAHDSLADLRGHLEVRAYMIHCKDAYVRGQCENTRSKALLNSLQAEIDMDADRYRNAYISLGGLASRLNKANWQGPLQKLDDSHIRHISVDDGSGSVVDQQISWIWFAADSIFVNKTQFLNVDVNRNLNESLRIEWCKARARALRWTQECELLREEMRRVAKYREWAARRWDDMVGHNFVDRDDYLEGADASAYRQASLRHTLRLRCLHA